jgi:hypothetical protein
LGEKFALIYSMGRFIAAAILAVLLVAGFVRWIYPPRHELPAPIVTTREPITRPAGENEVQLRNLLIQERTRLVELERNLATVQAVTIQPTNALDMRLAALATRIQDAEEELLRLVQDGSRVELTAQAFDQNRRMEILAQQAELEGQIQDLDVAALNLQTQLQTMTQTATTIDMLAQIQQLGQQIETVRANRELLMSRVRGLQLSSQGAGLQVEIQLFADREGLRFEQEELQRQLADLRDEEAYWNAQKEAQGQDEAARAQRVSQLENEIVAQRAKLADLERRARTPKP